MSTPGTPHMSGPGAIWREGAAGGRGSARPPAAATPTRSDLLLHFDLIRRLVAKYPQTPDEVGVRPNALEGAELVLYLRIRRRRASCRAKRQ